MNRSFVVLIITVVAFVCTGQSQTNVCATAASMKIRDFYIGMTTEQAQKLYTKLPIQIAEKDPDEAYVEIRPNIPRDEEYLGSKGEGLSQLSLLFVDRKLVRAEFGYENVGDWKLVTEFTDAVASPLGLPSSDKWLPLAKQRNSRLRLDCGDITLFTFVEYRAGRYESTWPSFTMRTLTFEEDRKRRSEEKADAKRKAFKP